VPNLETFFFCGSLWKTWALLKSQGQAGLVFLGFLEGAMGSNPSSGCAKIDQSEKAINP
jgi:hypothetical protein